MRHDISSKPGRDAPPGRPGHERNRPSNLDVSERRPYLKKRKTLPHDPPHFIGTAEAIFFVTICTQPKGKNQLCKPNAAKILFDAARFYEDHHDWYIHLLLLMPDHLHFLARFSRDTGMKDIIERWKRYTATQASVTWQRDFFDHRLRNDESLKEKAYYIRMNPVRAGLTDRPEDWPYVLEPR